MADLTLTIFADVQARRCERRVLPWPEVIRLVETAPTAKTKATCKLLKLAAFGNRRTAEGCLRHDANIEMVYGAEIDYDGCEVSIDEAVRRLERAKVRAVAYTSPSHTDEAPRWRVLAPLAKPVAPQARIRYVARLNGVLGGIAASESYRLSQSFYFGPVAGRRYLVIPTFDDPDEGQCVDELDELDAIALAPPSVSAPGINASGDADLIAAIKTGDKYHDALVSLAARYVARGMAPADVTAALEGLMDQHRPGGDSGRWQARRSEIPRIVAGAAAKFTRGSGNQRKDSTAATATGVPLPRPSIAIYGGDRHLVVVEAEKALAQRDEIYQRGGALVRVAQARVLGVEGATDGGDFTDPLRVLMSPADPEWLTTRLTEVIDFQRPKGKDAVLVSCDAPEWLGRALIAERQWTNVRPLNGVTSAPIIRPDGSVCTAPGYDKATGMLLVASIAFEHIKRRPTRDDALAALAVLRKPYAFYKWASAAAEATALSLVLSRLARHLMPTCPLHLFEASKAGSGKTSLVEAASVIVDGVRASLRAWPDSEEEMRKSITACLLASHGTVCFDNVPNGKIIKSAVLDKLLTNVVWEDRLLGGNSNVFLHNNLVVAATGNNVRPSQDTVRRVVSCRVVVDTEDPWNRDFPWTPIDYASRHRAELVAAACTVLSAFIAAGQPAPAGVAPLGTFEEWSRLVRNALLWLGLADPVSTQDDFLQSDPAREVLVDLLRALHAANGDTKFRCADVINAAFAATDGADSVNGELRRALKGAFEGQMPDTRRLGRYFDTHREQLCDGLMLKSVFDKHSKTNKWMVEQVAGSAGSRP